MRAVIFGAGLALAMATSAFAQTADKKTTPGDAPTKSMDAATPEMKGPGTGSIHQRAGWMRPFHL